MVGFSSSSKCSFHRPTTSSVKVNSVPSLLYVFWMVPCLPLLRWRTVSRSTLVQTESPSPYLLRGLVLSWRLGLHQKLFSLLKCCTNSHLTGGDLTFSVIVTVICPFAFSNYTFFSLLPISPPLWWGGIEQWTSDWSLVWQCWTKSPNWL